MDIKLFRIKRGIQAKEIVDCIQVEYPSYDKTIQSRVESGKYPITLTQPAVVLVKKKYAPQSAVNASYDVSRSRPYRITFRLYQAEFERLQLAKNMYGYETMQDFMVDVVTRLLREARGTG